MPAGPRTPAIRTREKPMSLQTQIVVTCPLTGNVFLNKLMTLSGHPAIESGATVHTFFQILRSTCVHMLCGELERAEIVLRTAVNDEQMEVARGPLKPKQAPTMLAPDRATRFAASSCAALPSSDGLLPCRQYSSLEFPLLTERAG